jgi:hypothetical protein
VSRADEYRKRARDHKARVALSHMAQVWLALADRHQDELASHSSNNSSFSPRNASEGPSGASSRRRAKPSRMKMSKGREGD